MTCKTIGPLLDGYHDGELGALERWRVDRHLTACAACRRDLASLDAIGDLVRASVASVPSLDLWSAIANQLPGRTAGQAPSQRRRAARLRRTWLPGLGLAAAAAAAGAAFFLLDPAVEVPAPEDASGVVRSVYAPSGSVMVLEAERAEDPTVIWLMDPPAGEVQEVSTSVGI